MRRILLVLSVAALMAAMMAATAVPAFASKFPSKQAGSCGAKSEPSGVFIGEDFITASQTLTTLTLHFCKN